MKKTTMLSTGLCRLAALAMLILAGTVSAHADAKTLWQIGQIDRSYSDLAIPGNYPAYKPTFSNGVVFHVGTDDPAKAWPFIHPGLNDIGWAGGPGDLPHQNVVVFNLPDQPKGVATLTVAFVGAHNAGSPTFVVDVNGAKSSFGFPVGSGEEVLTDPSKGNEFVYTLPFTASLLKPGENRITLSSTIGSWAIYDGLNLTDDPDATLTPASIIDVGIAPTERVVQDNGKSKRIIVVTAHLSRGMTPATITVSTGSHSQQYPVVSSSDLSAQTEVQIDDSSQPVQVNASVTCGSATKATSAVVPPAKHMTLYIIPSTHVDIGYTDYQERVVETHDDNVTYAFSLFEKYPDFKWNSEAAWVEDNYFATASPSQKAEFRKRAKEGRLGTDATYANMLTGLCSHEAFIRNLYYAHRMSKQYGVPFDIAASCDVPRHVWTLPSVLSGSGVHYFAAGLNFDATGSPMPMDRPFYWQGPDGGRVLTWFSQAYGWALRLGLTQNVETAGPLIDDFLRRFDRSDYKSDAVLAYGAWYENHHLQEALPATVAAWNKYYVTPKIVLCRGPEFFHHIEKTWKGPIPVISGDFGAQWEDGAGSTAFETGLGRTAPETLLTAEKLNALTTKLGKPAAPTTAFDAAWRNSLLWDEHTWGAAGSVQSPQDDQTLHQWKVKAKFATDLASQADTLLSTGMTALSKAVKVSEPSVVVYNPLNWPTSGPVEAKTSDGTSVAFHADQVPALGYKVYPRKSLASIPSSTATYDAQTLTLSNKFYTLQVDRATGALHSIYDKELNRELLAPNAPYGANQYVYFGSKEVTVDPNWGKFKDITNDDGPYPVSVAVEDRPAGKALIIKMSAYNTPEITSEILLHDDQKRIDFINTINKKETLTKEAAFYAFPFALNAPRLQVELPDGVLHTDTDSLPGATTDHYCMQDFVAAEDSTCAITWTAIDTPLVTLSMPNYSGGSQVAPVKGYVYGYVFNNIWDTNYKASQGGKFVFRFAMTSARKYDPVASARFGQTVRNPLIAGTVAPAGSHHSNNRQEFSLCSASPANVEIQAVKQADLGQGTVIRLRELTGHATKASLNLAPGMFKEASLCNLMEDAQSTLKIINGKLTVPITANGLATIRLQ